ncbi:polymorphic toxin-type HINT domain-containing protein [Streptomyces thermocoprophilus]|uniref:Polymorphic toxin-type HINT domain-containing protein n=1 Tax=Streptomyces thermocoprophilus TaxID=78356 RepID=A0ABV5V6U8_9ACTN
MAAEKAPAGLGRPDLPAQRVSKVKPVTGLGAKQARDRVAREEKDNADRARRARTEQQQKDAWPTPGSAGLRLTGGTPAKAAPGKLPVTLAPAAGKRALPKGTDATVTVLDQDTARRLGITGVVLTAQADKAGTARIGVDYTAFASAIGGGWAGRLQLVRLPECALTTPDKAQCRTRTPLASHNDPAEQTVAADVSLPAQPEGHSPQRTSGATAVMALTASGEGGQASNGTGDYSATPLSSSSSWAAGGSSGAFTWSYNLPTPPAAAGPAPELAISYDSGSVDGRTATTNNQPTSVGEGFTLTESYIERGYADCDDDGHTDVHDRCWLYDNARLVLDGKSSRLVKTSTAGVWKLENDDSTTVTRLTGADNGDNDGEYWKVVTGDGTTYVFGQDKLDGATTQRTNSTWTVPVFGDDEGEPGYTAGSTFAGRAVTQAWRWNLDHVVDTRGNAATYWYDKDTNYYKKNKASKADAEYVRSGRPKEITYGLRAGALFTDKADAKVTFEYAERCTAADCSSLTKETADNWPDVPFDAICAKNSTTCTAQSPSFFTRKRLTGIHTFSWNAATGTYDPVDSWAFTQRFLDGGDIGDTSDQVLTLQSIKRTAKAGTPVTTYPVSFTYQMRPNRVDATDDILPMTRPRISTITSETGAITTVTLSAPECLRSQVLTAPQDSNTRSCYPKYWNINGAENASVDWFHKYRVLAVVTTDPAGHNDAVESEYAYSGAAWHFDDDPFTPKDERTWSDWRGYRQVTVYTGSRNAPARSKTVSVYMQGMDGDRNKNGTVKSVSAAPLSEPQLGLSALKDSDPYSGFLLQQVTYDGATAISATSSIPWSKETARQSTAAGAGDHVARMVRTRKTTSYTYLTVPKTWRSTAAETVEFDARGRSVKALDTGDTAKNGDETCTQTWYADNDTAGLTALVSRTRTVALGCGFAESDLTLANADGSRGNVLSDTATAYDGLTWSPGMRPTKGLATWTARASAYAADGTVTWDKRSTTEYDTLGRPVKATDAAGNATTTAHTPADAGPLTRTVVTNALGHQSITFIDPRRGLPTSVYDANRKGTALAYDALGRITDVWLPNRNKNTQSPNQKFTYSLSNTRPSWVSSATLKADGDTYNTSYAIYDSLLRPLQTQQPTPQGGRLLTDTRYDSRGLAYETYADIFDSTSTPDGTYTRAEYGEAPVQTLTTFDGAGRATSGTLLVYGVQKQRTTTVYTGDSVAAGALAGGSATRTITDALGRTVETREYAGTSPADPAFGGAGAAQYTSVKFTYTPDGKQKTITGPDGSAWSHTYDQYGRESRSTDPDQGTTRTWYDILDRPVKTTTGDNTVVTAYDSIGRPTATWKDEARPANLLTKRTYDAPSYKGLPATSTRYVGGENGRAYTKAVTAYDDLGRPTTTQLMLPAGDPLTAAVPGGTLTYTTAYRLDGTVRTASEPALGGLPAETLQFGYGDLGQPTSLRGATGYVENIDYTALGQAAQLTLGFGGPGDRDVYLTNTYEEGTGRLTDSSVTDDTHPYVLQDLVYGYDQAGNVTSVADPTSLSGAGKPETQCFSYDGHRRLTDAWTPATRDCTDTRDAAELGGPAPYWTSWTYNAAGQRQTETRHTSSGDATTRYCYDTAQQPHALRFITTRTQCGTPDPAGDRVYEYDTAGNTTGRPGDTARQTLTWNVEGRLEKLTEPGKATTEYVYDADGTLLIRTTDTGERVLYAGVTELHLPSDGSGAWAQRMYTAGGTAVALRTDQGGTHKVFFLAGDDHGTQSLMVTADSRQAITKRFMSPFGSERGGSIGAWETDKGFLGKTLDATTGLTHIGAREYDTSTGQFISVDPLLETDRHQTLNGYSYAAQNPLTYSDPSGMGLACGGHGDSIPCPTRWDGTPGNGRPAEAAVPGAAQRHHHPCNSNCGEKKGTAAVERAKDGQPMVGGIRVPPQKELEARYAGSSSYGQMLSRWAQDTCYIPGQNGEFCEIADQAGLLPEKGNDPWGIRATYHCLRGRGDCGEAIAQGIITLATMAFGSVTKALIARSGGRLAAAEAESAAASLYKAACSFTPDTPVLLKDGKTKPISKVEPGDEVEAADPETGEHEGPRTVEAQLIHHDDDLVDITARTADGREAVLHATSDHPFWNATDHTWTPAGDLRPGTRLTTPSGTPAQVTAVTDRPGDAWMYNLTVADLHTYYVLAGATPVLVHNSGGCGWATRQETAGDVAQKYTPGQSTRDPASQWYHEELSDQELLDSINKAAEGDGIAVSRGGTILGGHHRWDELQRRIQDGRIDPDTPIRIDVLGED